MMEFRMAEIRSVDAEAKTAIITIRPDMANIQVQLDNPTYKQYVPVPGQQVLALLISDDNTTDMSATARRSYVARIVCEFGDEEFNIQKSKPIQSGEIMVQGQGGGFFYADQSGNVMLSDKVMSNVLQLLVGTAINMMGNALSITIKDVGQINIIPKSDSNPDAKIELVKKDSGGADIAKVTIQNDKIVVQGPQVEIGTKDIGYVQAGVVTSQSPVEGNHSLCFVTGAPIPCSKKVTAANTPV